MLCIADIKKIIKDQIIPRIVYLPYIIAYILSSLINLIARSRDWRHKKSTVASTICIEAGIRGWDIIEYKELYQSAIEYLGSDSVERLVFAQDCPYLTQLRNFLKNAKPSHYAYSPRTGGQSFYSGMRDAFGALALFTWYRVTPVVFLTDLPIRLWRAQSAVVTAKRGLVVSLMAPRLIKPIFPHARIIGPYLMPLSATTLTSLKNINNNINCKPSLIPIFTGSLYEPRTSTLNFIQKKLFDKGIQFKIKGRELGSPRVTDEEYWCRMISAPIVLTTADQIPQAGADWPWIPHFVYRYTEVLASGSILFAPEIPGISRYFQAGVHYISFDSIDDAVNKITYYLEHPEEGRVIARQGHTRINELVNAKSFWLCIDVALGANSIT